MTVSAFAKASASSLTDDSRCPGICAMEKKAKSGPLTEILNRITSFTTVEGIHEFRLVFFSEEMILNQPIEEWPKVDILISFYSSGFPMEKGLKFVNIPTSNSNPSNLFCFKPWLEASIITYSIFFFLKLFSIELN